MHSSLDADAVLERAMWDMFWLPPDAEVVDRPEIKYASHARDVIYFNQVTRVRAPAIRFGSLVEEVVQAHRGRRSRWLISPRVEHPDLEAALSDHGYRPSQEHDAFAIGTSDFRGRPSSASVTRVASMPDLEAAMAVGDAAFHIGLKYSDDEMRLLLERCAQATGRMHRFLIRDGSRAVASAGMTLYDDLSFGLLWGGATLESERHNGLYTALVAARVDFARARGIEQVGLYAGRTSSAPIVSRLGLHRYGEMIAWTRDAAPAPSGSPR